MDIRLFCYRCFVFLGLWVGYEAQNGNQTTHQRTDDVEEAEGKIDQGRDAKNCTLRHTAIYLGMGIAGGDDTYTVLHTYLYCTFPAKVAKNPRLRKKRYNMLFFL